MRIMVVRDGVLAGGKVSGVGRWAGGEKCGEVGMWDWRRIG